MVSERLDLVVASASAEAKDIVVLELEDPSGVALPGFSAGAHIDLHLPNDLVRSYSLLNLSDEHGRYTIAVQRDAASRGGSSFIHETIKRGDVISTSFPRNNFVLDETADFTVLIGGGIGVTPLIAMAKRLEQLRKPWVLHYCTRTREHALLGRLPGKSQQLMCNFDQEPGGAMLNIRHVIESAPNAAHFYCCGPAPMMAAFVAGSADMDASRFHVEYFSASQANQSSTTSRDFEIVLAKSGRTLKVGSGETILDVLIDHGYDLPYSCMEGVCGSCETEVLEGEPDHRDLVLSAADRARGKTMMICCSGAKSDRLVLNL